jgi:upstream activation factor subunit UAF30
MVKKTTTQAPVATPAPAAVEKPVVEKKASKKSSEKAAAPVVAAPAPVVEAAAPAVDAAAPVVEADAVISSKLNLFGAKIQQVAGLLAAMKAEFKALEKTVVREFKTAQKTASKKKKATGNRRPSGFIKPTKISNELATFLGKEAGTEMARTDVSREINAYIKANKLQDPKNGRKINADSKLSGLLKLGKGEELTYFNLQKYLKPLFLETKSA